VFQQRFGKADFDRWFNGLLPTDAAESASMIVTGMVSYFVFGFLDNAGLFFGSNYLDDVFQNFPFAEDANVFAG